MANPYAAFNVSDDEEEGKVNVVKTEDKPKRSRLSSIQLTSRRKTTKNSKSKP
jgi:hypothetical protein